MGCQLFDGVKGDTPDRPNPSKLFSHQRFRFACFTQLGSLNASLDFWLAGTQKIISLGSGKPRKGPS
jgi:hypothetical protein